LEFALLMSHEDLRKMAEVWMRGVGLEKKKKKRS
jgi:hypothetical protein